MTSLCCIEYVLLDPKTGSTQELFETGKLGLPIGVVINQQLLLNKDNISIFYGFDGLIFPVLKTFV